MSKISKEAIERFKELHPERFAELQAQAERDWDKPIPRRVIHIHGTTTTLDKLPKWFLRGMTVEQMLEEFRAEHGSRHFLITTSDGKRYFEGGFNEEDAVAKLSQHKSYCRESVVSIEEVS